MRAVYVLAIALVLTACSPSPTEPLKVCLMITLPGYTLNADSLEAEGWRVLPGDTLAVWLHDEGRCPGEES